MPEVTYKCGRCGATDEKEVEVGIKINKTIKCKYCNGKMRLVLDAKKA